MMAVGFVYFVFVPSIVTTPMTGNAVARFGTRPAMWGGLGLVLLRHKCNRVAGGRGVD
jgi:MFS transporter, YNFM family, putative membrane transport protein